MAQVTVTTCDCGCGAAWSTAEGRLPERWWVLSDEGRVARTGPIQLATLACVARWVAHPQVRERYAPDFEDVTNG
ncbi:MAG: hypothetical protein Q8L86_10045 [Vicinamibacterales bacterium]|nr:hypothetical protein [Vicinamibacterales bacterium]